MFLFLWDSCGFECVWVCVQLFPVLCLVCFVLFLFVYFCHILFYFIVFIFWRIRLIWFKNTFLIHYLSETVSPTCNFSISSPHPLPSGSIPFMPLCLTEYYDFVLDRLTFPKQFTPHSNISLLDSYTQDLVLDVYIS